MAVTPGLSLLFMTSCGLLVATTLPAQGKPAGWDAAVKALDELMATDRVVGGSLVLARSGAVTAAS
ncbi:MAG: hypothetical protein OEV95_08450, partial [Gemmatimonadota bacterium]|nr:hypothetical protein [Gemmatimonadota bacterium]